MMKIKVFVVDDHTVVREGIKRIITGTADMEVAGEAGNGRDAIIAILKNAYDVVLLDLTLPDMAGLDVLRTVKAKKPTLPVLVLSIHPEEQYAGRVFKEGASGYLTKESAPSDLVQAIRKVAQGKKYISDSFGESLLGGVTGTDKKETHESLSSREYQIFRMIIDGRTVKEIAGELSLASTTVSSYRTRILEKMGMKTNLDLMRYALDHQLID